MLTAFIVLTYNHPTNLLQVLQALAPQCDERHEIIIADDGSNESSIAEWRTQLPKFSCAVRHVWHPDQGFTIARARNLAVAATSADYLVFMDGDCIPNPHFVSAHTELAEQGYFVNGSRVLLSERLSCLLRSGCVSATNAGAMRWIGWWLRGDSNKVIHLLHLPDLSYRRESKFRWKRIHGCNLAVWRNDYLAINGFDESFSGWGHEDADLVLRLHNAGVRRKNGFCATEVYHLWHQENSRSNESVNRDRVTQRIDSGLIRATQGIDDAVCASDVVITALN